MTLNWSLLIVAQFEHWRIIVQPDLSSLTFLSLLLALVTHVYPTQGLFGRFSTSVFHEKEEAEG